MTTASSEKARIRLNLAAGELEIEGTEEFLSQYADPIEQILERMRTEGPTGPPPAAVATAAPGAGAAPAPTAAADEPFGEVLHSLSSKSGTDQILLAGLYVGKSVSDGTFSTVEAHKLLMEQSIRLSNASQSMKNNLTAKRAFKVGSRFKVSKMGLDHLDQLRGKSA